MLGKLKITLKKTFTYSEKSEEQRRKFTATLKRVPSKKRVYGDKSDVNTCLTREYARAVRGEIVKDSKRRTRFQRQNVIGAVYRGQDLAIMCYKKITTSAFFEDCFKRFLLAATPAGEGYTVIMDIVN